MKLERDTEGKKFKILLEGAMYLFFLFFIFILILIYTRTAAKKQFCFQ